MLLIGLVIGVLTCVLYFVLARRRVSRFRMAVRTQTDLWKTERQMASEIALLEKIVEMDEDKLERVRTAIDRDPERAAETLVKMMRDKG